MRSISQISNEEKNKKIKVPDNSRLAEMKMADGFKANVAYFKLGFLDKASVRIGRQFREMFFAKFSEKVGNKTEIETVYLVTDSDADYRSMSKELDVNQTYQLYRDYLDNFRINGRR